MKHKIKSILLFLLAGIWIEFNEIPIIPLGFIAILLWVRPINFKRYRFLILAMVLGFVGTGFSFKIFKEVTVNPQTGIEHHFSKYLFNIGLGTQNITQFLKRGKITLYKDNLYQKEQKLLDNYLRGFVKSYNQNSSMFSEMKEKYGEIEDMYYIGNLEEKIPNINPAYLRFVYNIKFSKKPSWQTIHFSVGFDNQEVKILKMKVQDEDIEYEIKTRRVYINYKESTK